MNRNYQDIIIDLISEWTGWSKDLMTDNRKLSWHEVEFDGEVYLLSNMWNYMRLMDENQGVIPPDFLELLIAYTHDIGKQLKKYSIVEYQRQRRVQLYTQQIQVLESIPSVDLKRLALAYMYRGESYFLLMSYSNTFSDYDKALEILHYLDMRTERSNNDLLPLIYFNRGEAKRRVGYFEQAIEDFTKSISYRQELLKHGVEIDYENLAEAYKERGYTYRLSGNTKLALEDMNESISILNTQIDRKNIRDRNALAKAVTNRGAVYADDGIIEALFSILRKGQCLL